MSDEVFRPSIIGYFCNLLNIKIDPDHPNTIEHIKPQNPTDEEYTEESPTKAGRLRYS